MIQYKHIDIGDLRLDNFVVIDIEGNGFFDDRNSIVELGILTVQKWTITSMRMWRVSPMFPISKQGTKIHGITNASVSACPKIAQISNEVYNYLNKFDVCAGHSVNSDLRLLERQLPDWRPKYVIDTLLATNNKVQKGVSRKLEDLRKGLGIELSDLITLLPDKSHDTVKLRPHTALYDALVSYAILRKLRLDFQENHLL